jgi:hypothetical protein
MTNSELIFTHPAMTNRPLVIPIRPDQITWSYGLNTQTYPTFDGEVVQILSMYVGDMQINGTVSTYKQMEDIYSWFIQYMQNATQGGRGRVSKQYDSRPVEMHYLYRGWKFDIYPKSLPGFRYGKEVVAPTWQLTAAISEYSDNFRDSVLSEQMFAGEAAASGFEPFGTATGEIGYEESNPWSAPDANKATRDAQLKKLEDHLVNLIPTYLDGSFKDLESSYSQPHIKAPEKNGKENKTEKAK